MNIAPSALLILNLLLQAFDCTASYFVLSRGAHEANPLVETAIESWGACMGLALLEGLLVYTTLSFVFNQTLSGAANRGSPKLYRSGLFLP